MPRTGRRRSLTIAAAVAVMLAAPAAANAATYTIKGGDGPCQEPADLLCGSMQEAADAAIPGDIFNVAAGPYLGAEFEDGGVTINGAAGVTLNGTLEFSGDTGGVSKANKLAISQGTLAAPGVLVTGDAGLELTDSVVVSSDGQGIHISGSTANKIVRTAIATGGQQTAAVRLESTTGTPDKALRIESSILIGGKAGIGAYTSATELEAPAGDISIQANHITAAGSTYGVELDSSQSARLLEPGEGNIAMTLNDSIAFNNRTQHHQGLLSNNDATITATRTMLSGDPAANFVNPSSGNFRLKAGAPAINAGGITPGESPTDIEGNDRSTTPTDQGADEFVAPTVVAPPPPPPTPVGTGDGTPPAVVITKPKANQRIKITTKTTKTTTVTRKGKKVKVKKTTSKRTKIGIAGTAKDPSGIKGVVLTIEKISSSTSASAAQTTPAPAAKCRYFSATKGIVLKSCAKPNLLVAKVAANGTWTFNVKSTIRLGAGRYRVIVVGADNSGALGNSAPRADAIRLFTLTK